MIDFLASFWIVCKDSKRKQIFHLQVKLEKTSFNLLKLTPDCVKVFSNSLKPMVLKLQCMGNRSSEVWLKRFPVSHLEANPDCQGWNQAICTSNRYHQVLGTHVGSPALGNAIEQKFLFFNVRKVFYSKKFSDIP